MVSTEKGREKRERETGEKVSWSPNRQLPYHFQLDLVIPDGTQEQFSCDGFLSHQQLVVDSSTAIVELYSKGKRELTPKCEEHRNGAIRNWRWGRSINKRVRERDREGSAGPRGTRTPHSASGPAVCGENRLCWGLVSVGAVLTYSDFVLSPTALSYVLEIWNDATWTHAVVISPAAECIIGIDILKLVEFPHCFSNLYDWKGQMEAIGVVSTREDSKPKPIWIPGGGAEISATIKDMKHTGVVVPATFPLTLLFCLPIDRLWRMTVDCHELNQAVSPLQWLWCPYLSQLVHLILVCSSWLSTHSFFSVLVCRDHQRQFAFSWQDQRRSSLVCPYSLKSPSLCYNLAQVELDHLSLPQDRAHWFRILTSCWLDHMRRGSNYFELVSST